MKSASFRSLSHNMEKGKCSSCSKKGNRQRKMSDRPISLLPTCGKIFKKIIFDGIYQHLFENDLISTIQSGIRPDDSNVNQLLSITHIYQSIQKS